MITITKKCVAKLNILCKTKGVTVRSTIDLIIAQTAIENRVMLLTCDNDFFNMTKAIPDLKIFEV